MNERIREIAREAGIKMYHSDTLALGYIDTAHRRFAELIVKECVSVVKEHYDDTLPWGGVENVLEHFGVDE